jgi:hypothetical protein
VCGFEPYPGFESLALRHKNTEGRLIWAPFVLEFVVAVCFLRCSFGLDPTDQDCDDHTECHNKSAKQKPGGVDAVLRELLARHLRGIVA